MAVFNQDENAILLPGHKSFNVWLNIGVGGLFSSLS
jgi:hypothetical protein